MTVKMENFPAKNPNPVLSVAYDGTVLYSNKAGEPLLNVWGTDIGEKLPHYIRDFMQKVISQNIPDKMEVKVGKKTYIVEFHPVPEEGYVHGYGFDISDQKELEASLLDAYQQIETQSKELDLSNVELQTQSEELREANEALLVSEERLRLSQQVAKVGSFEWNIQTGVNVWTPELEAMYGLQPGEFGKTQTAWEQLVHPEDRQKAINTVESAFQTAEPVEGEWRVILPDGNVHWLIGRFKIFRDEAGQPQRLTGVNIDITERKQTEESLKKQAALIDLSPDAIITCHLDGTITFWSKGAQLLYGWTSQEAVGQTTYTLLKTRFPQPLEQIVKQLQQTGYWSGELIHYNKDGRQIVVQSRWKAEFDDQSKVKGMLESNVDITERKKAEEELWNSENRFRVMFEEHGAPMLLIEPYSGQIIDANKAAARFYEYSREQLRAMSIDQINQLPPGEVAAERYNAVKCSRNVFIFTHRLASGDERLVEVYSSPVAIEGRSMLFSIIHDITLRKKAEEALQIANETLEAKVKERTAELEKAYNSLKESERSLAEAQELAHIGSWDRIFATNILHWSDEMYRIFGFKPQEFEMTYDIFLNHCVHPDDQDYFDNAVKGALNGKPFVINFRIIKANGEERIVHAKGEAAFDEQNNPVLIRGITQDITERKKAEEALRQSEERFNLAVKAAQEGIWDWNIETNEVWYSPRYKEMLGYSEDEIENHMSAWLRLLHPDDKERSLQLVDAVMRGERKYELEFRLRHKDGHYLNILSRGYPVRRESDGKIVRIVGIHLDITEGKQAEEKIRNLANIVESSNDAIVTKSLDGIITSWNKGAEKLYGYSAEEVLGKPVSILEPPVLSDETKKLTKMIKQGEEYKQYETLRIRKDGKAIHVSITLSHVFDINGKMNSISVIARDITKRKEAEEALAKIEIARKQEIHHRIKNNLQVISSLLDLQAEQFKNQEYIKDSEVLEAFRNSKDRVISMALIHEELYKGGGFETLNLSQYMAKLAENLFQTYGVGNKGISLKLDLAENAFFDMDIAIPLGIIVNELVSNSFKHAFAGKNKGEIQIKLYREESGECISEDCESTSFILTVSDNGIGIPEDLDIENLDSLGLQLVTTLVEQLDGELDLRRDNGTEFIIRFMVTENNNSVSVPTTQQSV